MGTGAWLASMTKNVTSVAIMHAIDKRVLNLDDDVTEILPEIKEKQIMIAFDDKTNKAEYMDFTGTITLRYSREQ
jgi:CubicO group peptidase (beta-lactamase class C family)